MVAYAIHTGRCVPGFSGGDWRVRGSEHERHPGQFLDLDRFAAARFLVCRGLHPGNVERLDRFGIHERVFPEGNAAFWTLTWEIEPMSHNGSLAVPRERTLVTLVVG